MAGIDGPHFFYIGGKSGGVEPRSCGMPFTLASKKQVFTRRFALQVDKGRAIAGLPSVLKSDHKNSATIGTSALPMTMTDKHKAELLVLSRSGVVPSSPSPGWQYILLAMS